MFKSPSSLRTFHFEPLKFLSSVLQSNSVFNKMKRESMFKFYRDVSTVVEELAVFIVGSPFSRGRLLDVKGFKDKNVENEVSKVVGTTPKPKKPRKKSEDFQDYFSHLVSYLTHISFGFTYAEICVTDFRYY